MLNTMVNRGVVVRRTGGLVVGAAVVVGSALGAQSANAAGAAGPTASIGGWSKHVVLKPGGASKTFTVSVQNFTDHTIKHVDGAYSTYAADQPVLKEYVHGKWKTLDWGHTPQRNGGTHSFAALAVDRTLKPGATATYKVKVSLPKSWDKKVTQVKADAGAEGEGWSYFLPVGFKVAR